VLWLIALLALASGLMLALVPASPREQRRPSARRIHVELERDPPAARSLGSLPAETARLPWRLVVRVRDNSGTVVPASLYVTDGQGDLLEKRQVPEDGEAEFELVGTVGLRVAGPIELEPRIIESLSAEPGTTRRLQVALGRGLTISGWVRAPRPSLESGVIVRAFPVDAPWNVVRGPGWDHVPHAGDDRWLLFEVGARSEDGGFEIPGLRPGRYQLVACPPEEFGTRDTPPVVEAGTSGHEIWLQPNACVKVRFVDSVTRGGLSSAVAWDLSLHDDSRFEAGGMIAAAAMMEHRFWLRPHAEASLSVAADGYCPREPALLVAGEAGEERGFVCELHPDPGAWAEVELHLRDDKGDPVTDMRVWRWCAEVGGDEEGIYRLRLPAGNHMLHMDPVWTAVVEGKAFWLPADIEIRLARGERVRREVTIRRGAVIRVRSAVDEEPRLLHGGARQTDVFWAVAPRSGPPGSTERVRVAVVPPGTYRVAIPHEGDRAGVDIEATAGTVAEVNLATDR